MPTIDSRLLEEVVRWLTGGCLLPASMLSHPYISMSLLEMLNFKSDINQSSDLMWSVNTAWHFPEVLILLFSLDSVWNVKTHLKFLLHFWSLRYRSPKHWKQSCPVLTGQLFHLQCTHISGWYYSFAEFVKLVSVDTRLWFWMGSEVTSLTLAWEPVLGTDLHDVTTIYSWLLTGQQWMQHPLVLARRKSH